MKLVILDHPWPLEAALDGSSPGFQVLEHFEKLVRKHELSVVPFLTHADLADAWTRIDYSKARTSGFAALRRFGNALTPLTDEECCAVPNPEPPALTRAWKRALRHAVESHAAWRHPQIIIGQTRRGEWPESDEVEIRFEQCEHEATTGPCWRVLVSLEEYESHPFALSDFDPWDLRRTHPIPDNIAEHRRHPCCLPKPLMESSSVDELDSELAKARSETWGAGGKYYYLPPPKWNFGNASKEVWRNGRVFPYRQCRHRDSSGYVDYAGREWVWDDVERHWDVQTHPGYLRIRHTGEEV